MFIVKFYLVKHFLAQKEYDQAVCIATESEHTIVGFVCYTVINFVNLDFLYEIICFCTK